MPRYDARPNIHGDWCVADVWTREILGCYSRRYATSRKAALRYAARLNNGG